MRTSEYGKITEYSSWGFSRLKVPIKFESTDRWICHIFQSIPSGNGNWGSELIVLVDNFGETYYFSENDSGNGYTQTIGHYTLNPNFPKDNSQSEKIPIYGHSIYLGLICSPKKELDFAFTDDFIDILKASYTPGNYRFYTQKPVIDEYVATLLEKNKKVEKTLDNYYTPRGKEEEISVADKNKILSAAEKRMDEEMNRGFQSKESANKFHTTIKLSNTIHGFSEEQRLQKISDSWAYDS